MDVVASTARWRFAQFELQPDERRLLRDGELVVLRPLTLDVLRVLVEAEGHLVTKRDLLQRVWGKAVVEENALQAQISALRRVVGNESIATVPGSGYRFALEVNRAIPPAKHNLPLSLTNFIGREREFAEVQRFLTSTRLVTLVGTGGCGKTRLAVEVARSAAESFADGAWIVELAPLADPSMLTGVVARALLIDAQPGIDLLRTLLEWLESKRILLVLDNAEHLLGPTAELAHELLRRCPGLVILVTSRERLAIDGERTYTLSSMSVPLDSSPQNVLASEAARMFIDRARLHRPDFEVAGEDISALASICSRLDGIALAIELAVPQIRIMPLVSLSEQLDERFSLLISGSRVALPRHRTLRSMIDWSHNLLSDEERILFRRLSVFAGGCTVELARGVCSGDGIAPDDVQALMMALVEKSLLTVSVDVRHARFDMLETVRHYAQEQLRASYEEAVVRGRQLACLCDLAKDAQYGLDDALVIPRLAQLGQEHDNVSEALAWSEKQPGLAVQGLELAGTLNRFWRYGGAFAEGRSWLARLMDVVPNDLPGEVHGQALHAAGSLAYAEGDFAEATELYDGAIEIWRRLDNQQRLLLSLGALGEVERARGDRTASSKHFQETLQIARDLGDLRAVALALADLARLARDSGDQATAQARLTEGMSLGRKPGLDPAASLLSVLAEVRHERGDLTGAREALEEGIGIRRLIGHRPGLAEDLLQLSEVLHDLGENEQACRLGLEALATHPGTRQAHADWLDSFAGLCVNLGGAVAAAALWGCAQRYQELGSKRGSARTERLSRAARQTITNIEEFDRAWAEGRTWSLEHGIARARELAEAVPMVAEQTPWKHGQEVAHSLDRVRAAPGI